MLKYATVLFCLLVIPASLRASDGYEPFEYTLERADFVLHLKVVEIDPLDGDDYAVCAIKEVLMGLVVINKDGRVCVTIPEDATGLEVGDEFTLVAPAGEVVENRGMVFNGGGYANERIAKAPDRRLRKLVQAKLDAAYAMLDDFEKIVPGAREEAKSAVMEHESGKRSDYTDISPEADLVLDLVAINRGAPAESHGERPALDAATRHRLGMYALRGLYGVAPEGADVAMKLIGDAGHGANGMLTPADIEVEVALETLRKLDELGELAPVLSHLVRHDMDSRALTWAAHLVLEGGYAGRLAQWIWIEHLAGEPDEGFAKLRQAIGTPQSEDAPYADPNARVLARLIDAEAWALGAYLQQAREIKLSGLDQLVERLRKLSEQDDYLAVYAFIKATTAAETDALKQMKQRLRRQDRYSDEESCDLDDLSSIQRQLQRARPRMPVELTRAIRNHDHAFTD